MASLPREIINLSTQPDDTTSTAIPRTDPPVWQTQPGYTSEKVSSNDKASAGKCPGSQGPTDPADDLLGGKRKQRIFHLPVDEKCLMRFKDLRQKLCPPLVEHLRLRATPAQMRPLDMSLVHLGQQEADARPCILLTCNKGIAKHVEDFFNQAWVKVQLRPPKRHCFPEFEYRVEDKPCRRAVQVFESVVEPYPHGNSLNGYPIYVSAANRWDSSRIGGFVEVHALESNEKPRIYALTAGHLVHPWTASDCSDSSDEKSGPPLEAHEFSSLDGSFELDPDVSGLNDDVLGSGFSAPETITAAPDMSLLGDVFELEGSEASREALDYTLVSLLDTTRCLNARVLTRHILSLEEEDALSLSRDRIVSPVIDGETGADLFGYGLLSLSKSSLLLNDSIGFIDTYKLRVRSGNGSIKQGDSGTWVANAFNKQVYGQIVAIDVFGDAHVMPLERIFKDIEDSFTNSVGGKWKATFAGPSQVKPLRQQSIQLLFSSEALSSSSKAAPNLGGDFDFRSIQSQVSAPLKRMAYSAGHRPSKRKLTAPQSGDSGDGSFHSRASDSDSVNVGAVYSHLSVPQLVRDPSPSPALLHHFRSIAFNSPASSRRHSRDFSEVHKSSTEESSQHMDAAAPISFQDSHRFCPGAIEISESPHEGFSAVELLPLEWSQWSVDGRPGSDVRILQCKHCGFCGNQLQSDYNGPEFDTVSTHPGTRIRYRWLFLAKSHVMTERRFLRWYKNGYITREYCCIFCSLQNAPLEKFRSSEALMDHIWRSHRHMELPSQATARVVCIMGREADTNERFDINIPP